MDSGRIAIVGVGPVGGILGAYLLRAGADVTLIDILDKHLDAMKRNGLKIEGKAPFSAEVATTFPSLQTATDAGQKFDIVFVCVKAPVNPEIASQVPGILSENGTLVSFQNGLDTAKPLLQVCDPDRTVRGVINYAGNLIEPGRIKLTFFNPPNYMGAAVQDNEQAVERAKMLADLLQSAELTCEYTDNVGRHVWAKVIRNAGLMPISALTGMNMAEVMESETSLHLVETLLREAIAVARQAGFEFDEEFFATSLAYYRNAGRHMPSMWADVQASRRTEIDFLNGGIARHGKKHGVNAPYNRAIANLVKCIDELAVIRKNETRA